MDTVVRVVHIMYLLDSLRVCEYLWFVSDCKGDVVDGNLGNGICLTGGFVKSGNFQV